MPLLEGLAINLIAAGVARGFEGGQDKVRKTLRRRRYDVDDLPAEFNDALRSEIEQLNQQNQNVLLTSLVENWGTVARELDDIRVAFDSEEKAIDEITQAILTSEAVPGDPDQVVEERVRDAVTEAYQDAARKFRKRVAGTQLSEELDKEADIKIIEELDALTERLDELKGPRYYETFDPVSERDKVVERLPLERDINFIDRPELETIDEFNRVLITGRAGSGKTRLLAEAIRENVSESIETILVPNHSALKHVSQIEVLEREEFTGDVLLVWDDIHAITEGGNNEVFEHLVSRLEALLNEEGNELHVFSTARSGRLSELPGNLPTDFTTPKSFWYSFEEVRLEDDRLSEEDLKRIAEASAQHLGGELDDGLSEQIATKAKAVDPSPYYVVSALSAFANQGTITEFEELPETALDIWTSQFDAIATSDVPAWGVLRSVKLLSEFDLPPYASLVKGVYLDVLDCDRTSFDQAVESLAIERSWLSVSDKSNLFADSTKYGLHDIQLTAIDDDPDRHLKPLSEFFLSELSWYLPSTGSSLETDVNKRFGNWLRAYHPGQYRNVVQDHYEKAVDAGGGWDCSKLLADIELVNGDFEEAKKHYLRAAEQSSTETIEPSEWALLEVEPSPPAADCLRDIVLELDLPLLLDGYESRFSNESAINTLKETYVELLQGNSLSGHEKRRVASSYTEFNIQNDTLNSSIEDIWPALNDDTHSWTGHLMALRNCNEVKSLKDAVDEARKRDSFQPTSIRRIATYLVEEGDISTAEEYIDYGLDEANRLNDTRSRHRLLKEFAETLSENGNSQRAEEVFDKIDWIESLDGITNYADFILENYDRRTAITFFQQVAEQSPRARAEYAEWLATHGMLDEWAEQYEKVLAQYSDPTRASLDYAEIVASLDKSDEANHQYQELLRCVGKDEIKPLRIGYCRFLIECGEEQKAKEQLNHLTKEDIDLLDSIGSGRRSSIVVKSFVDLLIDAGEFERAIDRLHSTIEDRRENSVQNTKPTGLRLRLSRCLLETGKQEPAFSHLKQILTNEPWSFKLEKIHNQLIETGHESLIDPLIDQTELRDSEASRIYLEFGKQYLVEDNHKKGERMIKRAVELNPNLNSARVQLGLLQLKRGELQKATKHIESSPAAGAKIFGYASLLKIGEGQHKVAKEYLDKATSVENIDAESHMMVGQLYTMVGMFDEAGENFKKAVEVAPQNNDIQCRYAEYLFEQGKIEQAESHFQKACSGENPAPDSIGRYTIFLAKQERIDDAYRCIGRSSTDRQKELYIQLAKAYIHLNEDDLQQVKNHMNKFIGVLSLSELDESFRWLNLVMDFAVLISRLAQDAPDDAQNIYGSVIDTLDEEDPVNAEQDLVASFVVSMLQEQEEMIFR